MKEKEYDTALVSENMNYVKAIASKYRNRGVEFDDLVSEGYMAMVQAAQKYDQRRNTPFAAYAAPFIRKAMEQAIALQGSLYTSSAQQKSDKPTATQGKTLSIDAPLDSARQYTLLDMIASKDIPNADYDVDIKQILEELSEGLEKLEPREREVVRCFYGFGRPHLTLQEIAAEQGLKRERARQIRDKALRKLSKDTKSKILKALLKK